MPDDTFDEDVPLELLWKDLRASPLWLSVERGLLAKRDRMVALMVVEKPKPGTDVGVAYAEQQRRIGYIEALNAIVAEPEKAQKAAARGKETSA